MRPLIIGQLEGQLGAAAKIARERGGKVIPAADVDAALRALRHGSGADLIVADATLDIRALVQALEAERMNVPVVVCCIGTDARRAVEAICGRAAEFIPLPSDLELTAVVLTAPHDTLRPAKNGVAPSEPATRALIGRTVFDVERDLILDTLDYCLSNRTHAANILGISVRTLRNKLRDYAQADTDMAQPGTARMVG